MKSKDEAAFRERWDRLDTEMRATLYTYWHTGVEPLQPEYRGMVDELAEYVLNESDKKKRGSAYFTIGKLGLRCRSVDCARILIDAIGREKDRYVLMSLLDRLADIEKPREVDLSPVFPLLKDARSLVRHSAIKALGNSDSPEAEAQVIAHLNSSTGPYDISYCNGTLATIGSMDAIPHIERNFNSPKSDIKHSARYAVHAIMARHGVRP